MPRTTLKDGLAGRVKHGSKIRTRSILEDELVSVLTNACKMGHGKTKREVIDVVRRTVKKKKEKEGKDFKNANLMVRGGGMDLYKGIQNCLYVLLMHYHIVGLML